MSSKRPERPGTLSSAVDIDSPYFTGSMSKPAKKTLPPWLDHFNARDLKTLFKCSVAVWIGTILMFVDPYLRNYGQAVFFAPYAVVFIVNARR